MYDVLSSKCVNYCIDVISIPVMTDLQLVLLLVADWRLAWQSLTQPPGEGAPADSPPLYHQIALTLSLGQSLATFHENLSMGSCKENKEGMQKPSGNLELT